MIIRPAIPDDREVLLEIWQRSTSSNHDFVSAEDKQAMIPEVREYLASTVTEFWVLCDETGKQWGFMGLCNGKMESLFLSPEHQGKGGGRKMVEHARSLHPELTVDVNEQNASARIFYEKCGFVVTSRSPLDDQGRPYPLLHMKSSSTY